MIYKGLDDEEAVFLQQVADKRAQVEAEARNEEREELTAYRVSELTPPSHTHTHTHTTSHTLHTYTHTLHTIPGSTH